MGNESSAATRKLARGIEMQFDIQGNINITTELRGHIERRLCFALERFARRIRKIRVNVADLNGPRGGIDKRCRVAIVLEPSRTIVMEDRDSDIYVAIDRAADRIARCVRRQFKRLNLTGRQAKIPEVLC
jgi:ribosome hibernation promoting factor